jgi:hypothetical protein
MTVLRGIYFPPVWLMPNIFFALPRRSDVSNAPGKDKQYQKHYDGIYQTDFDFAAIHYTFTFEDGFSFYCSVAYLQLLNFHPPEGDSKRYFMVY